MRRTMSFLIGAVFGGMIGSISVLLLAPGSGQETQMAIQEKLSSIRLELQNAIADRKAALESELERYKTGN